MIVNCNELSTEEQKLLMDKVREWKRGEIASKMVSTGVGSHEMTGRGLTPKTYEDLNKLRAKKNMMNVEWIDYVVKDSSGRMIGVIGYKRNYVNEFTTITNYGLYVIHFDEKVGGPTMVRALREIYGIMLDTAHEVSVEAVMRNKNPRKDPFKKDVLDKYTVIETRENDSISHDGTKKKSTWVLLRGNL